MNSGREYSQCIYVAKDLYAEQIKGIPSNQSETANSLPKMGNRLEQKLQTEKYIKGHLLYQKLSISFEVRKILTNTRNSLHIHFNS